MPKFSVKDLLIATVIVASGLAMAVLVVRYKQGPARIHQSLSGLYFLGCILAGGGFAYPFIKSERGWFVGVVIGAAVGLLVAISLGLKL